MAPIAQSDPRGRIDDEQPEEIATPSAAPKSQSGSSISEEDEEAVLENLIPPVDDLEALHLEEQSESDEQEGEEYYDEEEEEWDPEDEDWDLLQGGKLIY